MKKGFNGKGSIVPIPDSESNGKAHLYKSIDGEGFVIAFSRDLAEDETPEVIERQRQITIKVENGTIMHQLKLTNNALKSLVALICSDEKLMTETYELFSRSSCPDK